MTDIFGCCCSVDVQHIQTTWWDPVQVYSYSDWEKYPYFSLPLPWVNSHSSYFFKTLKIRRWGGGSWSRRQRYPQQSCFIISETSLKLALTVPSKMPMQDPCEELLMSRRILALDLPERRSRCGPKQLHRVSQGERAASMRSARLQANQTEHFQRGWTSVHGHSLHHLCPQTVLADTAEMSPVAMQWPPHQSCAGWGFQEVSPVFFPLIQFHSLPTPASLKNDPLDLLLWINKQMHK